MFRSSSVSEAPGWAASAPVGAPLTLEPTRQLVGEQEIGELGLSVAGVPVVTAVQPQVVEIDLRQDPMPRAAHRDYAGAVHRKHVVEKQTGEREVTQMVCAKLQLEAVFGAGLFEGNHTGIVDQKIDALMGRAQRVGGLADAFQGR